MVVVVGAGVSGLALASFLEGDLRVLEADPVPGGNVRSDHVDGRVLDRAANGWLSGEPAMDRLLARAGLDDSLVPASDAAKDRFVWAEGALHPVPLGPGALVRSRLLPLGAKLRLLLEPFVGRVRPGVEETVAGFVRRRLGKHFVDRLVAPMVAGVFAGDPESLSLRSAFPRMAELEREHGSLVRAMIRLGRGGAPRGHLTTLQGGAGALTAQLAERLGPRLQLAVPVEAIERTNHGFRVTTPRETIEAETLALAAPGHVQAGLVRRLDPEAAQALDDIPYAPIAVVMSAFSRDAFRRPPAGFGVLRARGEALASLGTLFTSEIFPAQARPGELLLRTMVGGAIDPASVEDDDATLEEKVLGDLDRMFGLVGAPSFVRIVRHARGIPQYTIGHAARVEAVRRAEQRHPGLYFTGNHLDGVAVKDCVRAGEGVARRIMAGR
jgi:protoporphyrinogen/coproporphyrinogen III oxidase